LHPLKIAAFETGFLFLKNAAARNSMGRKNLARLAPEGLRGAGQAMMLECIADAKPIMAATSDEEQVFNWK
jgi:hypothetical protein